MIKVVFIGDCHGRFDKLDDVLSSEEPFDIFLSVGDVGVVDDVTPTYLKILEKWKTKGYMIRGNHDNAQFFEPLTIHQEIAGLQVSGLNGMVKSRSFIKDTTNNISFREILYASHLKDIDILVTHQPPFGVFQDEGEQVLQELLHYLVPKIYIFGHIHKYKIKFYLNTFLISLPLINKGHVVAYFDGKELKNIEVVLRKGKKLIRV